MLANAENFTIQGSTLNNVGSDQYNQVINIRSVLLQDRGEMVKERQIMSEKYGQFREIIRGETGATDVTYGWTLKKEFWSWVLADPMLGHFPGIWLKSLLFTYHDSLETTYRSFRYDWRFLDVPSWCHLPLTELHYPRDSCPTRHISAEAVAELRFDTVYSTLLDPVARWPGQDNTLWELKAWSGLENMALLRNGLIRFNLGATDAGRGSHNHTCESNQGTETEVNYFMVDPTIEDLELIGAVEDWTKIPEDKWETLGLPTLIPRALPSATVNLTLPRVKSSFRLFWWPKYVYSAIKDWEAVPGFDPAMPDFACHPGYPELEIIKARKQERRGFEKQLTDVLRKERWKFLVAIIMGSESGF
uniref:Uncharacterized protein n=1 Tax=Moniliophthora roreri TaxID=221103 RepID=A0A0W0G1B7_MONRR